MPQSHVMQQTSWEWFTGEGYTKAASEQGRRRKSVIMWLQGTLEVSHSRWETNMPSGRTYVESLLGEGNRVREVKRDKDRDRNRQGWLLRNSRKRERGGRACLLERPFAPAYKTRVLLVMHRSGTLCQVPKGWSHVCLDYNKESRLWRHGLQKGA